MSYESNFIRKKEERSMSQEVLLTGNAAIATGVKLCRVDYIPAYPITPQTEIIETLSRWISEGKMRARLITMESEHSMLSAAGAASVAGVRTFTATSSQGLLYAFEMLYNVAGWRAPVVLANVSRAVAAPMTLEPDHNDVLSARDCGFLQIHAETCQEALDSIIMAYKVAEDIRVRLPAMVNLDGFYLSYTRENVSVPEAGQVSAFLPDFRPVSGYMSAKNPMSVATVVLDGRAYSYFKYQMHLASLNALKVHEEVSRDFAREFGREYNAVDEFMLSDAEYVIVMTNSFATMAKAAIMELRKDGKKVGLLRPRLIRPFPRQEIAEKLAGKKGIAVLDQNISVGSGGIIYPEVQSALYHLDDRPKQIVSFIGGLGGKRISHDEFKHMISVIETAVREHSQPAHSIMLFTDKDWGAVKGMLQIAGKQTTEAYK
jgi:pyruvate ferredoxin oxidoreductase alpha subunit